MDEHISQIKIATLMVYSWSASLIVNDWVSVIDNHAPAFGLCIAFFTALINRHYQAKEDARKEKLNALLLEKIQNDENDNKNSD
jgi:hypothetical protein